MRTGARVFLDLVAQRIGMLGLSVAFLLIAGPNHAGEISASGAIDTQKIDALFSGLAKSHTPGFAVLVRRGGKTLFERGYGVRDLQSVEPIDAQTNFRLASNSKQFTAVAIMLLVHDGKLRYDESLREVFPEFPAYGAAITIGQMLQHTSGLVDYEALMDEIERTAPDRWSATKQIRDGEVLALLEQQSAARFAPGTQWEYSNSGYVLLGLIVAKTSGRSFPDFLRDRIFSPLGMHHTLAYVSGRDPIANRAYGHASIHGQWQQTDQSSTSATLGDGGIYSNLEDLARWDDALTQHRLLSATEMRPALLPVRFAADRVSLPDDAPPGMDKTTLSYGYGWFLDPYHDDARMWHYGDTTGFKSAVQRVFLGADRTDPLTVVVLANRTDCDPTSLAIRTLNLIVQRAH